MIAVKITTKAFSPCHFNRIFSLNLTAFHGIHLILFVENLPVRWEQADFTAHFSTRTNFTGAWLFHEIRTVSSG